MKTVHYNVSGLANSESKTKLRNALDEIEGVQKIAVDLHRGTVEVLWTYKTPWYMWGNSKLSFSISYLL